MADAADEGDLILLEALPGTPAKPEPAAGQLGLDVLDGDLQARRQALERGHQARAVGFPGGQQAQH